jgi:hypothetical protein
MQVMVVVLDSKDLKKEIFSVSFLVFTVSAKSFKI